MEPCGRAEGPTEDADHLIRVTLFLPHLGLCYSENKLKLSPIHNILYLDRSLGTCIYKNEVNIHLRFVCFIIFAFNVIKVNNY